MQYAIILFCLLSIVYANNHYKHFYNPITFFCSVWIVAVTLATMRLNGLYETSQKAYTIVFLGTVCFVVSSSFGIRNRIIFRMRKGKLDREAASSSWSINTRVVWLFVAITLLVLIPQVLAVAVLYLQGASMHDVRVIYASGESAIVSSNAILSVLNTYVSRPFEISVMPLSMIAFYRERKKNWALVICCALIIIFRIIIDAGRVGIIQWIFSIIFIITFSSQRLHGRVSQRIKLRLMLISIVGFIILVYLSSLREIKNTSTSIYSYICGCLPYLDLKIKEIDSTGILTYGASGFFGVSSIIAWLLSIIGIRPAFFTTVTRVASVQEYYFIGTKIEFNSFVSTFYHLYIDGRWLGVMIGMLAYGYFCGRHYKNLDKNPNTRRLYIYTLILLGILFSFIRFPFVKSNYFLAMCFTPVFFKKSEDGAL